MHNWELPLVLFTVLGQAAVGAIIFSAVLEPQVSAEHVQTRRALRAAGAIAFPLLLIALVLSVFHLGQPMAAYRALRNFGSSWLSREIWFFGITAAVTAVYSHLCHRNQNKEARTAFGYLAGLMGLLGVWSSAMVYALPARAMWSPVLNTLAFMGTTALLGGLVVAVYNRRYASGEDELVARVSGWAVVAGALLSMVSVAGTAVRAAADPAVMQSVGLMVSSWLFWVQLMLGLVLPVAVAIALVARAREVSTRYVAVGLGLAVVGELAGRIVFYTSALGTSLWG
ncbi:MAG TPA: DmsC/YnfH family molybdoenzyme membrane anchor subunit [Symbiobacteriaceae bacterium]|nr:DmsC/YnfH family molybdoenzyme membrane anchor subunit [Symbiobacteriaceae bacterium]